MRHGRSGLPGVPHIPFYLPAARLSLAHNVIALRTDRMYARLIGVLEPAPAGEDVIQYMLQTLESAPCQCCIVCKQFIRAGEHFYSTKTPRLEALPKPLFIDYATSGTPVRYDYVCVPCYISGMLYDFSGPPPRDSVSDLWGMPAETPLIHLRHLEFKHNIVMLTEGSAVVKFVSSINSDFVHQVDRYLEDINPAGPRAPCTAAIIDRA